jgi:magnesium-protoporphyrin O-methyltransferase
MTCSQCVGIEKIFNEKYVTKELKDYRRKGPVKTTRWLIDALKQTGVQGLDLLDIGGGVGAIQHELIAAGVSLVTGVDAASAYIQAAKAEAERAGYSERATQIYGDFVDLAPGLAKADIVTLDRVICCYHDMDRLVRASVGLAKKYYGVIYPRSLWWTRLICSIENIFERLVGNPYRAYVHPTEKVEAIIKEKGFTRHYYRQTLAWQVVVYARG